MPTGKFIHTLVSGGQTGEKSTLDKAKMGGLVKIEGEFHDSTTTPERRQNSCSKYG